MSFRGKNRIAACAGIAVCLVVALGACGGDEGDDGAGYPESVLTVGEATAPLTGAAPELREIRAEANQILDGGLEALEQRLAELRGIPVVVNRWASWCGPCIYEFPHFQTAAVEHGGEIAFLGIDFDDGKDSAETFLERLPVPFPSYADPDGELSRSLEASAAIPSTVFIGSDGRIAYRKFGPYEDVDDLLADIDRYAN